MAAAVSVMLALSSWRHWLPIRPTEMLGALTGAWGIWLTAEESLWNWPVGIASSLLFAVLFFHARLYGAMGMQLAYVVLGGLGWYWWLHGGTGHSRPSISRTGTLTGFYLAGIVALAVPGLTLYLRHVHDASPPWDATALSLCLAAQYLVTTKRIEHWHFSIAADGIYGGLYLSSGLFLTGGLYLMHLGMCVVGLWQWRRTLASLTQAEPARSVALV